MKIAVGKIVNYRGSLEDGTAVIQPAIVVSIHPDGSITVVAWDERGRGWCRCNLVEGDHPNQWGWPA